MNEDDGYRSTYEFGGSEEEDEFPWYVWLTIVICFFLVSTYQWFKKKFGVDYE